MKPIDLLKKFVEITEHYQDKDIIKKLVIGLVTDELHFSIGGVFAIEDHYATKAITSSSNYLLTVVYKLLGTTFENLKFDLNEPNNIFAKAANTKKYQLTRGVTDFIPGLEYKLNNMESIMNAIMKLYGISQLGVFPCFYKGELKSFFVTGHPTGFSKEEIDLLNVVSNQLAGYLSFADLTINLENKNKEITAFNITLEQKVKEATTKLEEQNKEIAEQLRKEKDMMDILGHELRTPLSIARNAVGIIQMEVKKSSDTLPKAKIESDVEKAMNSLRKEVKIVETVLSSTKIENDRINITYENVECSTLVKDSVEGYSSEATNKGIKLIAQLSDHQVFCWGGTAQVAEIIDNLISNAVKYTNKGSVKAILEESENEVKFSVIDTGDGIPAEDIPNLGKKFFRSRMYLESPNQDIKVVRPGGTGIGLYVVKGLLELMKGKLEVNSEVGKGSTFTVYLPKKTTA